MAVLIDANTEYIDIADNAKFTWEPEVDNRALSLWWKSSSLPNVNDESQSLAQFRDDDGNKVCFYLLQSGGVLMLAVIVFNALWAAQGYFYHAWTPSTNTWYHIVFNCGTTGNCSIYVDCVDLGAVTELNWNDASWAQIDPDHVWISDDTAVSDDFDVAHWAFWDDMLSHDEIKAIRWDPRWACGHPDLLCYLPLDELTGVNARDFSASSGQTITDGTLTNDPTWSDDPPVMMQVGPLVLAVPVLKPTTAPPTTAAPTSLAPTTLEPTAPPTTLAPTEPPTTLPVATTPPPTTLAPTTLPTTLPTTVAPTTLQPTSKPPTSKPPTSKPPTSLAPTSLAPTEPPTSLAPTSLAPTEPPTSLAPTSLAPTEPPTTVAPTTLAPTEPPTTLAPTTLPPTTLAPPTTVAPTTTLTTLAPTTLAPTTLAPTLAPTTAAIVEACIVELKSPIVRQLNLESTIVQQLNLKSPITKYINLESTICRGTA